jgi:hypothetical protein
MTGIANSLAAGHHYFRRSTALTARAFGSIRRIVFSSRSRSQTGSRLPCRTLRIFASEHSHRTSPSAATGPSDPGAASSELIWRLEHGFPLACKICDHPLSGGQQAARHRTTPVLQLCRIGGIRRRPRCPALPTRSSSFGPPARRHKRARSPSRACLAEALGVLAFTLLWLRCFALAWRKGLSQAAAGA